MWFIVCEDILNIELSGPALIATVSAPRTLLLNTDKYLIPIASSHCSAMHYSQSDRTKRRAAKIKSILGIYSEARRLHDSNSCDWLCWGMDPDWDESRQTEIWNIEMWIQDKEIQFGFYFLASWPVVTPNQWWHYIITMYWGLMGLLPLNSSQLLYRGNQAKSRAETSLRLSSPVCHTIQTGHQS